MDAYDDVIVVALSRAYVYVFGPHCFGLIECPLGNSTDDRAYTVLIMLSAKLDGKRD